jgi:hypothetical protein
MSTIYNSEIGLRIYKEDSEWSSYAYTITGNVSSEHTIKEFESAHDFELWVRDNVACKTISFDSEFCQFFAYAKTKRDAIAFVQRVEKLCKKVQKIFA